jgi:hypothetical protein
MVSASERRDHFVLCAGKRRAINRYSRYVVMMWNWKWVVEEVERRNEGQGNSMEVIPITC